MTNERLHELTLTEHILELKTRVVRCVILFLLLCCIGMFFANTIYNFLAAPLIKAIAENGNDRKLIFTGLTEGFMTHMRVSIFFALGISLPYMLFELYKFLSPGLYKQEKKVILPIILIAILLFFLGISIAYFFVAPIACKFFISFEGIIHYNIPIVLEARISEYLSTIIQLLLSFGIVFQLPMILLMLCKLKVLSVKTLVKYRRHAVVVNFILAAIITPPDVISQVMLALPMVILYELSIILIRRLDETKISS